MPTWLEFLSAESQSRLENAASPPELVEEAMREIGIPATEWAIETAERVTLRVAAEAPAELPSMITGREREGCEACLLTTLIALNLVSDAAHIVTPLGAVDNARAALRQGVGIGAVLRTVWASHTFVQDEMLKIIESTVPREGLIEQVRSLSAALYSYLNVYIRDLTEAYEDEGRLWRDRLPSERRKILEALVAGESLPIDAERTLGLRFGSFHLFAIGWAHATAYVADREADLARFAAMVVSRTGASSSLVLDQAGTTAFWWTFESQPDRTLTDTVALMERPPWIRLAVGPVAADVVGARASYLGARAIERLGRFDPSGTSRSYEAFGLCALLLADPDEARRFASHEIGGLMVDDPRVVEVRETLRHFLLAGGSRLAAAHELHLASNTVAYRVRQAAELLGRPVTDRPLETLVALEIARALES